MYMYMHVHTEIKVYINVSSERLEKTWLNNVPLILKASYINGNCEVLNIESKFDLHTI